ncbi:LAME_0D10726g1_1 [Lachancea meyersii CBS 8951]|uniref:LAME_0D10726g1_1 n=1 Tax=Lachancea meyersii CBS 8951 TaxID=1266667 RepID=A0A1G4JC26_9SACH|nr:LAME_0D10726g1_1 [Lachancea meyersii CBS 8951]
MANHWDGFAPAHGVFYSVFHPTEGTKVKYEFPPGCLAASDINFSTIKNYVIPKPQLCNKLLTFKCGSFRLVCFPVNIAAPYYARNSFSFDFVFVFPYDCATSPYEPSIERLGKMFTVLEEQSQILSKAENSSVFFQLKADALQHPQQEAAPGADKTSVLAMVEGNDSRGQDYASEKYQEILKDLQGNSKRLAVDDLITKIFQDLNNYSECLIPIDSGNAVDIKLFPLLPPPSSNLSFEDVPISTVNLAKLRDASWDPTMLRIVPYINGINSISKISRLSDSDVGLVTECIKHFIYYNCVILADIFQFGNIYAPTSNLGRFLTDPSLAAACQSYVTFKELTQVSCLSFDKRIPRLSSSNSRTRNSNTTLDNVRKPHFYASRSESLTSAIDFSTTVNQNTPQSHNSSMPYQSSDALNSYPGNTGEKNDAPFPAKSCLFDLYRSFTQGQTVKEWYKVHFEKIRAARIDVRRFITFGTVHGLLYRCNSFPIMKNAGFLEAFKFMNSSKNPDLSTSEWVSKKQGSMNNLLSAADIKVGMENENLRKRRNRFKTADAAEEALNDVYRKLAINEVPPDTVAKNPMSHFSNSHSQSSFDRSTKGSLSAAGSDARSKVPLDIRRPLTPASQDEAKRYDMHQSIAKRRNEELNLLKAVRDVDSFDKICSRLEIDRDEVEEMLRDLGPYNVINT